MKFRYKVLFCNIIFVALAFAVSGYLLIRYNYHINLEKSVAAALEENQMLRMATEADVVRRIQTGDYKSLSDIDVLKENIAANLKGTQTEIDLVRENELERTPAYFEMAQSLDTSRKNYIIREEEGSYRLSCMSIMKIENTNVCIVNTKDITDIYEGMDRQIQYFRLALLVSVGVCSIVMFFISVFLTKSIKMLAQAAGKMASGDYSVRCNIRSNDEIGALGSHFNHMAASVAQHVEALEDENRRREDFVANFTHEIKTPMTAVIGYSDMLRSKHMTEEKTRVAAQYIFSEGKRLEAMSMKLFDLILMGKKEIEKKRIYIPDLLADVESSARPLADQRGVRLAVRDCEAAVMGDKELLKTVFMNMIDNACKASPQGGTVVLRAGCRQGIVCLEVEDRGYGIPEDELDKITEAFYMVDKSRSRRSGGAGLGLSLAAKIIELHDAKLRIQSEEGKGTCMQIFFHETGNSEEFPVS